MLKWCKFPIMLCAFLFFTHSVTAESAPAPAKLLTLKDAILLSLRYNSNIQTAELDRVIEKFSLRLAENAFEVQYALDGSAEYNNAVQAGNRSETQRYLLTPSAKRLTTLGTNYSVKASNSSDGTYYNPGVNLNIKQPLLRGFGKDVVTAELRKSYNSEEIKKLALKSTIMENVASVIENYRRLVSDINNLTIQKLALKASEETVRQNEARIKAGTMAPAENIQAAAQIAKQQLFVAQAENTIEQDRLNLLNFIGLPPETLITVPTDVSIEGMTFPSLAESRKLIFANNIDYQTTLITMENNKLDFLKAKDNQRWELNVEADVGQGNGSGGDGNASFRSLSNNKNTTRDVKLTLSMPIDDLKRQQDLVQAKIQLQKDKITLEQKKRDLDKQIISALHTLETERKQIKLAIAAQQLAEKNLDIAYKKLKYGQITMFEVNSLQTDLTNARLDVVTSKLNYLNDINNFQRALGILLDIWNITIRY